ncbi:MAG: AraC family transcriptional regulator, partial [Clostridia bacterium]|nr:AraC family transcriptional regulator [Clostridia bacterium]
IAIGRGFSSQEAFSRAFRQVYGITPGEYRLHPVPVKLQTIIRPFDCYLLAENAFKDKESKGDVKIYFAEIPEHKFLHIKNYESIGYWDFWQKQSLIPGQDCETVTGILDSIPHKLDDSGESEANSGAGQVMAFINEPEGRICSWGIPLAECYGVRLPADYSGPVPEGMLMKHVPKGEYIVFEHGPFDYETESASVEEKIERAMREFDYEGNGCRLSPEYGRIFYFFHDTKRFFKYIRPIERI